MLRSRLSVGISRAVRFPWSRPPVDVEALATQRGQARALSSAVDALVERVLELEHDARRVREALAELKRREAEREGQHAAALDALARLYKRVSARIAREQPAPQASDVAPPEAESTLDIRRRLGR